MTMQYGHRRPKTVLERLNVGTLTIFRTAVAVLPLAFHYPEALQLSFDFAAIRNAATVTLHVGFALPSQCCRCSFGILTHWGRVTNICGSKLTTIGLDNGLSPGRRQAIIRTNDGILLFRTLGTNFSEILSEIDYFHSRKCIWKCRLRNGVYVVSASLS